jgi:hypothetical protein
MKAKNHKTYRRFLGMIFLEGFQPALMAGRQWVATEEST